MTHPQGSIVGARVFAIGCGYADGHDLDHLRKDPAFKLACGRLPDSGRDLCSQPTISRLENAPCLKDVVRLTYALVDPWCASYQKEPAAVVLDIDDTCDVVHGCQQLSLFNAYYDERCFLPITWSALAAGQPERNVYDTERSRPVAVILRPGKTPSGVEILGYLRRLTRRIRQHWPTTRITFRGDSHYACPEAMTLRSFHDRLFQRRRGKSSGCETNNISCIFGLAGTKPLASSVEDEADAIRTERAVLDQDVISGFAETKHRSVCGCIWTPPDCNGLAGSSCWSQLLTYIRLRNAARLFVAASPDGFSHASTSLLPRHWLKPCRSTHQVREATGVTVSPSPAILLQLLGEISFLLVRLPYHLRRLVPTVRVGRFHRRQA